MHILIVSQYFWPENFRVNDIATGLREIGHEVSVLTSIPNYPEGKIYKGYSFFVKNKEYWNGITIYRCKQFPRGQKNTFLLLLNYFSFVLFASWKVRCLPKKFDKILMFQVSPVFQIIPAIIARKRFHIPLLIQIMDLWPETLASTSQGKNKWLIQWVGKISDYIYKKGDLLILPFHSSSQILAKRGISPNKLFYLPNSTESFYEPVQPSIQHEKLFSGDTHLLLAGNIGEAQGIEIILEAAKKLQLKYPGLRWIMVGEGRNRNSLINRSKEMGLENIFSFPGRFPPSDVPALIARADATLLTLRREPIFSITVPNRLQSYMACGKPILASIDGESASIIASAQCGLTAPAGDPNQFISIVEEFMLSSAEQRKNWGNNGRNYFLQHFERNQVLEQLNTLLLQENY
jgi:glycosyltransferase involved in cell wall biosynthesis